MNRGFAALFAIENLKFIIKFGQSNPFAAYHK